MSAASRRKRWLRALAIVALVLGSGVQFVPTRRTNPPEGARLVAPAAVDAVLRDACYDCHSHHTHWPWYSYVAPVSWWIVRHVERGRGDLNFSRWPVLDPEAEVWALDDIETQVLEGKMPLRSYTILHPEARLEDDERQLLLQWTREQREQLGARMLGQ